MRTITRTLIVVLTLTLAGVATPADAAERSRDARLRDREARLVLVIKKIVKRFFNIGADSDEMSPPKPTVGGQG